MSAESNSSKVCVVIGASHAGVNFVFALRKEGWQGAIHLFDADPEMPYHRPPLSKACLSNQDNFDKNLLKSADSYAKENIALHLGVRIIAIDAVDKTITLHDDSKQPYDVLVLATGARPFIPPIAGLDTATHVFAMRTAQDSINIRNAVNANNHLQVVVIGGGYIGLETAASLRKLGAEVTVLEREERILGRVTTPDMSAFFQTLHAGHGVNVFCGKDVQAIVASGDSNEVLCSDGTRYPAAMIVIGVGIRVNTELAAMAGLEIDNGIRVNAEAQTSNPDIYAIGDCSHHYNPHYDRFIRLECVQNAVDQAKVAAASICGKSSLYDTLPWFWSDQYDVKLQMVGLSSGYNQALVRREDGDDTRFSVWYFKDDELLAVDAVNNARAYMLGTKLIKEKKKIDKAKLVDSSLELKPASLLSE